MDRSNKIVLKNELEYSVSIKEGNAGVYRELAELGSGKTFTIRTDPNATYREYLFITLPDQTSLDVVSSDDFAEWKEIKIFQSDDKKFRWMGTKKRSSVPTTPQPGLFKQILNRFGF